MNPKLVSRYLQSAAVCLLLTGGAKLLSAMGRADILLLEDPLFFVSNRMLLASVAIIEFLVAAYLLFGRAQMRQLLALLWLVTNFGLYRAGLWLTQAGRPCPCLGTLTDSMGISQEAADIMLGAILLYLFMGSAYFLYSKWSRRQTGRIREPAAQSI